MGNLLHDDQPNPRGGIVGRNLLHIIPSFSIGGVPVRIARLINHFGERYRHTIIALDGHFEARERVRPDLRVNFIPLIASNKAVWANLHRYRSEIKAHRPDLLITYNWGAIDWAFANWFVRRCPHVHQEDGFGVEEAEGQLQRRILFRRLALKWTRHLIVPSQTLQQVAESIWHIAPEKVVYLPNGIDVAKFVAAHPLEGAPRYGARAGEVIIGTVAPLRPEKNLGRLVNAFATVLARYPAHLVIAGDGRERSKLAALVEAAGIAERVTFLGNVDKPETVLKTFDIFAISSDTEQMPTTVIEAMAAGLPIAGVDVGDIRVMVAKENQRYIVPRDEPGALAGALETLLTCPHTRQTLGARNQLKADQSFSEVAMFAEYDRIFSR